MRHLLQGAITFQRRKSLAFRHPSTLQDFWTIFGRCTGARCHACGKIYATCVAAARREETRACLVKIEKSANNKRMRSWHNTCQSSNQKRPRKMHNMRTHPFSERQLNEQKKQDLRRKDRCTARCASAVPVSRSWRRQALISTVSDVPLLVCGASIEALNLMLSNAVFADNAQQMDQRP